MLTRLRRRWGVLPTWIKVVPVGSLLLGLAIWQALHGESSPGWSSLVHSLYFLPLFMASLLFGLRGGLLVSLLISISYLLHLPSEAAMAHQERFMTWLLDVAPYFPTGVITGALVDREAREAQRRKQAAELALLGQAAAAVAHELKTPLVAIGGFAQRILRDLPPDHPHHRPLSIVVEQVGHMEQLLREMLDYSRPLELNLAPHPLPSLVEECLAMLALLAEQREVTLEMDDPPDLPVPVLDAGRIKQVVLNLVQNALQASERGAVVRVSLEQDGGWVALHVVDRGCGIRREDQSRVFSPFFTTKRQGTGLGLAISRKIAEAHGGGLEFSSQSGQGSCFSLRLPVAGPFPASVLD